MEYTGIIHPRKGGRSIVVYYGSYPLNPNIIRRYKPPFPNLPLNPPLKLGYWELLSPALFGAAGALFLSLFSDSDHLTEHFGGNLLKLAIIGYAIGATVAVSYAVSKVLMDSLSPYDHLVLPIWGALVAIILLFGANYLLLYRFFPSSFKGDVGDDFGTQLFSFLYLSTTTIATAGLGDILPNGVTARALIAIEISFYLFTMATAVQLLLVQKH
jgi:hypothetical protein